MKQFRNFNLLVQYFSRLSEPKYKELLALILNSNYVIILSENEKSIKIFIFWKLLICLKFFDLGDPLCFFNIPFSTYGRSLAESADQRTKTFLSGRRWHHFEKKADCPCELFGNFVRDPLNLPRQKMQLHILLIAYAYSICNST